MLSALIGRVLAITWLTGNLLAVGSIAFGQTPMPLRDGLKKLNQKRGTYFLYDPKLIDGQLIRDQPNWKADTEPLLTQLLAGTHLSFRKVGDCYVIEPLTEKVNPLPIRPKITRQFTISGFVKEQHSGEQLIGATVFVDGKSGTVTNNYGFYAFSLPETDEVELIVSLVGYQRAYRRIRLDQPVSLTVELTPDDLLDEVILTSDATERAGANPQTSQHTVPIPLVQSAPAVAGEKDVLKTLQFLPGIQKGLDGQAGLHVRGGGADQNLLILDEAPVYNANHLFGFVSVFNVDALKNVRLQKGGFSPRYGGRLSSVVEMNMREGSKESLHGEVGTGLITSRLMLEGPLIRNKASFLLTARHTNFSSLLGGFVAGLVGNYTGTNWKANFYDLNAKVNFQLNRRNQLYLSGYFGRDFFGGGDSLDRNRRWENVVRWGNSTGTLRWNHLFSERLFSNLSLIYSNYDFTTHTKYIPIDPSDPTVSQNTWRYFDGVTDFTLKYDLDYFPTLKHQIHAGFTTTQRSFRLNGYDVIASAEQIHRTHHEASRSTETSAYAEDNWEVNSWLKALIGARATVYQMQDQLYTRVEPRLSLSAKMSGSTAVRASYSVMNQFIHQLSNTGEVLPTDLWVPATAQVKPQQSQQAVLGIVHDLTPKWQLTVEAYQKRMRHIIGYHQNADFIGITNAQRAEGIQWEKNVTSGNGDAYGVELMLQRKTGRLSGWVGYTWALTRLVLDELNNGQPFYPAHDRRHTLTWVGAYEFTSSLKLSASWSYSSGNPQSLPVSGVPSFGHLGLGKGDSPVTPADQLFGTEGPLVQVRRSYNSFRAEPFHRLDLSLQKTFTARRVRHVLEATVVNVYGRRNPFYYDLQVDNASQLTLRRVSLFTFLPSINYTFRF
ncbi:TonB-dependent receptor [Spirosoma fluviale]|uniref:Outer membrane receptor proteins, mostly Fe transport n=1 Tax=Spirosoma fluviale TaxID=1597977 RepID=A0A286GKY6_9BACT|nr:TonB-dependent receptor [Spirosoma fluviale]SOD96198.1 Outer membrane receptor proteins, mostly Fe transport [Spirosoma fluviale]